MTNNKQGEYCKTTHVKQVLQDYNNWMESRIPDKNIHDLISPMFGICNNACIAHGCSGNSWCLDDSKSDIDCLAKVTAEAANFWRDRGAYAASQVGDTEHYNQKKVAETLAFSANSSPWAKILECAQQWVNDKIPYCECPYGFNGKGGCGSGCDSPKYDCCGVCAYPQYRWFVSQNVILNYYTFFNHFYF